MAQKVAMTLMPMSAMFRVHKGFSLVELLVTLVLMGLVASVVTPQIGSWLTSRERAAMKAEIASKLALLPLQAAREVQHIEITDFSQLDIDYPVARISTPISVLPSGFCQGGKFTFAQGGGVIAFNVNPPLCEVTEVR